MRNGSGKPSSAGSERRPPRESCMRRYDLRQAAPSLCTCDRTEGKPTSAASRPAVALHRRPSRRPRPSGTVGFRDLIPEWRPGRLRILPRHPAAGAAVCWRGASSPEIDHVEADRPQRADERMLAAANVRRGADASFPALDTADFENESATFSPILTFSLEIHR
jgi:hypothetical protein